MSKSRDRSTKAGKKEKSPLLPPFAQASAEESRRFRRSLLLVAVIYCLSFNSVPIGDTDDQLMLTSAFSFTEMGKFLAPSRFATKDFHGFLFGVASASGEVYSKYPPGYSIILLIFLLPAGLAARLFGSVGAEIVLSFPSIIALLGTAALIWRTSLRLGYGPATAKLLALAFALGSYAWGYAGTNYNEPYQALCAVAAFYCLLAALQEPRYWPVYTAAGGFALGYGLLLRPYFAILAPVLVLGALAGWRKVCPWWEAFRRAACYAVPALLASLYLLATNLVLLGNTTNFGYKNEYFHTPIITGLSGLLVYPRKGLIWFFPLVVLVPWSVWKLARGGKQWAVAVLSAACAAQILLISKWWGFESGRAWGDRLILAVIPFVALLAGGIASSARMKKAAWALVILGVGINSLGIFINRMAYEKIVSSANLPHGSAGYTAGQLPGHFWLLGVAATGPVLGSQEANPLWRIPPWIGRCPQCVPPPYRDAMNPIVNPWPLRLALPAEKWTRKEYGYMRGLLEIAIMRMEQKNPARALELLDRGLALNANSADFLAAKGMVILSMGDPGRALGLFDRAIRADPEYDLGLYGRGIIMEAMGSHAAARESYQRLLAAPPGMLDRKEVQSRLDKLPK
jgi:4-amino-4-deoxy-L-arabinose transferase-like glycosyltransferase